MGQYYVVVVLSHPSVKQRILGKVESWAYRCGCKLAEHAWIGSPFVEAVEQLLMQGTARLVWAGDYADPEPEDVAAAAESAAAPAATGGSGVDAPAATGGSGVEAAAAAAPAANGGSSSSSDLGASDGRPKNLYNLAEDARLLKLVPDAALSAAHPIIANHTKKQFVVKPVVNRFTPGRIHPLPILTCEGNGRGGGDLHIEDDRIGSWARDELSLEKEAPMGYTELEFASLARAATGEPDEDKGEGEDDDA